MDRNAQFAGGLWRGALIRAAIQREWLVSLGRRPALARMAHFLCEFLMRLQQVGLSNGYAFRCPFTQAELGDVLGLSTVHVNRTIQQLRHRSVISWEGETVTVNDAEQLAGLAEFDSNYLQINSQGPYSTPLALTLSEIGAGGEFLAG
jgi:CRP-like cAMP-binding protein